MKERDGYGMMIISPNFPPKLDGFEVNEMSLLNISQAFDGFALKPIIKSISFSS